MGKIYWSIFLYTICQRLSSTRKQIGKIIDSIQFINPSDLDLEEDLEGYRIDIALRENEEIKKTISNAIVALAWASIEVTLVDTCREVAYWKKLEFPIRIPDQNKLKFVLTFLKKNVGEVPLELYNRLSELETVRNCVVHAYGLIHYYRHSSKIKNLAKNRKWLRISNPFPTEKDEAIIVENGFISTILLDLENWFEESLTAIGFGPRNPIVK